jgi:3-hydroxyacyl-[acyl-carrier-protein] dehydratase
MLLNDLFIVDACETGNETLKATLHVRVPHPIFDGHFPDRPVLPGACMVQLVQELAASIAARDVRLIRAGQVKFITMIDPERNGSIRIMLTGIQQAAGEWQVTAEAINAGAVCFRFKGTFRGEGDYAG